MKPVGLTSAKSGVQLVMALMVFFGFEIIAQNNKVEEGTLRVYNAVDIVIIPHDVKVEGYFAFMDSLVNYHAPCKEYQLTEYLLVHANPWIIDTLRSFDYYFRKSRGQFVYSQPEMVVLHRGDSLWLPTDDEAFEITDMLRHTVIDLNIPEYKLRIMTYNLVIHTLPVRVGQNERKFLKTAGREVSLRTPIGEGHIIRIERNPYFVNPVTGSRYIHTKRDDGQYTLMPRIPWLEPEINGSRPGSLIHPTTNPETLGRAYSNGCVGTAEGDAWLVYYYAPLGTRVRFRYDLDVVDEKGNHARLKDIYGLYKDLNNDSVMAPVSRDQNHQID